MQEADLFISFVRKLNESDCEYMVTGSVASIIYGEPRLTHDLDVVVFMRSEDIDSFLGKFPSDEFYCPPKEVVELESRRSQRGHINIINFSSGFKLDVYFPGNDELIKWGLERRKEIEFKGEVVSVAPLEYVILQKLKFFREGQSDKHIRDIQGILDISESAIDFGVLEQLVMKYHLQPEWKVVCGERKF